jgi:hypothetical protein
MADVVADMGRLAAKLTHSAHGEDSFLNALCHPVNKNRADFPRKRISNTGLRAGQDDFARSLLMILCATMLSILPDLAHGSFDVHTKVPARKGTPGRNFNQ